MPDLTVVNDLKMKLGKSPKEIPPCYLYDARGSELYEKITKLDEYYPFLAEERLWKLLRIFPQNQL
jgi:L-histidine Nalpha-methyltransferase